jgi:hypothetical protein
VIRSYIHSFELGSTPVAQERHSLDQIWCISPHVLINRCVRPLSLAPLFVSLVNNVQYYCILVAGRARFKSVLKYLLNSKVKYLPSTESPFLAYRHIIKTLSP